MAIGCLLSACVLVALDQMVHREPASAKISPILAEAWGPLAKPDANALVVLERPDHYIIRALPSGATLNGVLNSELPPEVRAHHERESPPQPGSELRMLGVSSYRNGQVLGLAAVLRVLDQVGAASQVLPDRSVPIVSLRDRNALLFGDPNLVNAISRFMHRGAYSVEYDKGLGDFVVRERNTGAAPPQTFAPRTIPGTQDEYPGVLTVLPSDDPEGAKRVVIFAGGNSIGSQAAAEFFTSPKSLQGLKERFKQQNLKGFPRAYQVVVMGRSAGPAMLSFTYLAHRVLDSTPQQ